METTRNSGTFPTHTGMDHMGNATSVTPRMTGGRNPGVGTTTISAPDGHGGSTKLGYRRDGVNGLQHGSARRRQIAT